MQEKRWQRAMANAGGALLLLAVPAVALLCFSPMALNGLAAAPSQVQTAQAPNSPAMEDAALDSFVETQSTTKSVVQQARAESKALNDALRAIRNELKNLNPKDPEYLLKFNLIQQSLLFINAERNAWDSNWRRIGISGSAIIPLQNNLLNLQVIFIQLNTGLLTQQSMDISSGTTHTATAPSI